MAEDDEDETAMALAVYNTRNDCTAGDDDDDDEGDDLVYNDHHPPPSAVSETRGTENAATAAATTTTTTAVGTATLMIVPTADSSPLLEVDDDNREKEISQNDNNNNNNIVHTAAVGGEHQDHAPHHYDDNDPDDNNNDEDDAEDEEDDDANSSAGNHHHNNTSNTATNNNNKWHQNGYGHVVPKQSGKFSREESDAIKSAIEEYCLRKHITVKALCSEREHKADLKGAWMEIAQKLPERSVQSVYRHGIRQCHPFKRGAWSEAEVSMLQDLVAHNSKKWSMIQTKLNRSADSCRDKYREMSDDYVKGRWEDVETMELVTQIRCWLHHHTNGATSTLVDFTELAQLVQELNIQIPWSLISKRMGRRSRLSCFKKWQKLTCDAEIRVAFRAGSAVIAAETTTNAGDESTTATSTGAPAPPPQKRPSKRQKTEQPQQSDDQNDDDDDNNNGLVAVSQEEEIEQQEEEEDVEEDPTEYIVPMTEAHNNMVVTADEAELAAETVEALGLPDLIASKTTTTTTSSRHSETTTTTTASSKTFAGSTLSYV